MQQRTVGIDTGIEGPSPGGGASSGAMHGFREPEDLHPATGGDELLLELIETPPFQRLKQIRFLGAIDYRLVPRPNGRPGTTRYTRYEHSLGVMQLARRYCGIRDLQAEERRLACAAALLHDLGHPPLSHSMESVFQEEFGIDHHQATADVIRGQTPLGRSVFETLRRHGMDVETLLAVISGEAGKFDGFFHGPINFDTIEGIIRSYVYVQRSSTVPDRYAVAEAAMRRADGKDRDAVDDFWKCKNRVYESIIHSREGILADFACKLFLRRNLGGIDRDSYFGTEAAFFRKLPDLRALLTSRGFNDEAARLIDGPVPYRSRRYYIDRSGDFFDRRDDVRYRRRRSDRVLTLGNGSGAVRSETMNRRHGDLFDDDDRS